MPEEITYIKRMACLCCDAVFFTGRSYIIDWGAPAEDQWACSGASHGEKLATQFALHVWDQFEDWDCGRFEAYGVWDAQHRKAFQAWVEIPFTL